MNSTTTSTAVVAFSDVLNQQRRKEQLAEVRKEIALRCQVVQALKVSEMDDKCGCESVARQYSYQCERLDDDLTRERELEEQDGRP